MQLWDTAGQERFHILTPSYVKNASVVVFVYDVTSKLKSITKYIERESFEGVDLWVKDVLDMHQSDLKMYFLGNKIDIVEER